MSMNEDIKEFGVYLLTKSGKLVPAPWIKSTDDYNHNVMSLHHYIKKQEWERNKQWYIDRGIEQKLILMPKPIHEQVHFIAIRNLNDDEFYHKYKISRYDLIFNKRWSKYADKGIRITIPEPI